MTCYRRREASHPNVDAKLLTSVFPPGLPPENPGLIAVGEESVGVGGTRLLDFFTPSGGRPGELELGSVDCCLRGVLP